MRRTKQFLGVITCAFFFTSPLFAEAYPVAQAAFNWPGSETIQKAQIVHMQVFASGHTILQLREVKAGEPGNGVLISERTTDLSVQSFSHLKEKIARLVAAQTKIFQSTIFCAMIRKPVGVSPQLAVPKNYDSESDTFSGAPTLAYSTEGCWHTTYTAPVEKDLKDLAQEVLAQMQILGLEISGETF